MKLRKNKNKRLIKSAMQFQPWDYGFLLDIEKQALIKMRDYFETSDIAVGDDLVYRDLKLAIKLLEIATDEVSALQYKNQDWSNLRNYVRSTESYLTVYVNPKNYQRFIEVKPESDFLLNVLRVKKAWYLYNKLRYYRMEEWWN